MSQSDPLKFYFDPTLTSRQRMLCRMFWNIYRFKSNSNREVSRQIRRLTVRFGLDHSAEIYKALKSCYVYDSRYQCQVCRRLRLIETPIDLPVTPELPFRCDECSLLVE